MNTYIYILAVKLNIVPVYYQNGLLEGFKWFGFSIPLEGVIVGEGLFDYLKRKGFFTLNYIKVYAISTLGLIGLSIYLQVFPFFAIIIWLALGFAILSTHDQTN